MDTGTGDIAAAPFADGHDCAWHFLLLIYMIAGRGDDLCPRHAGIDGIHVADPFAGVLVPCMEMVLVWAGGIVAYAPCLIIRGPYHIRVVVQ